MIAHVVLVSWRHAAPDKFTQDVFVRTKTTHTREQISTQCQDQTSQVVQARVRHAHSLGENVPTPRMTEEMVVFIGIVPTVMKSVRRYVGNRLMIGVRVAILKMPRVELAKLTRNVDPSQIGSIYNRLRNWHV
jgi:hypothetical protein